MGAGAVSLAPELEPAAVDLHDCQRRPRGSLGRELVGLELFHR